MGLQGQLIINNKDAYTTWGITMDTSALAALMTPPALKDAISNESRSEHGKQVIVNTHLASREFTLTLNISAKDESTFIAKYKSFCTELATGTLTIKTSFLSGVVFHCVYISCSSFSQFVRQIGKFSLRLSEPNPNNRT